jgi:hypothetical protein
VAEKADLLDKSIEEMNIIMSLGVYYFGMVSSIEQITLLAQELVRILIKEV